MFFFIVSGLLAESYETTNQSINFYQTLI